MYLWWKLQASLIFLSGRTCTIGGWLNTFLLHYRVLEWNSSHLEHSQQPMCSLESQWLLEWLSYSVPQILMVYVSAVLLMIPLCRVWQLWPRTGALHAGEHDMSYIHSFPQTEGNSSSSERYFNASGKVGNGVSLLTHCRPWVQVVFQIFHILSAFALAWLECPMGGVLDFWNDSIGSILPGKLNQT